MKLHRLGDVLLVTRGNVPFAIIEGERVVLIQASVAADVEHYIRNYSIAHVVRELGVSDRVVQTLRKHFGIRGDVENKGEPK